MKKLLFLALLFVGFPALNAAAPSGQGFEKTTAVQAQAKNPTKEEQLKAIDAALKENFAEAVALISNTKLSAKEKQSKFAGIELAGIRLVKLQEMIKRGETSADLEIIKNFAALDKS